MPNRVPKLAENYVQSGFGSSYFSVLFTRIVLPFFPFHYLLRAVHSLLCSDNHLLKLAASATHAALKFEFSMNESLGFATKCVLQLSQ